MLKQKHDKMAVSEAGEDERRLINNQFEQMKKKLEQKQKA